MISALIPLMLEAALRALFAAVAVWTGLRLLRVGNVLVQKAAWSLVLVAALAMPLAPHWPGLTAFAALRLPALPWDQIRTDAPAPVSSPAAAPSHAPLIQTSTSPRSRIMQSIPPAADRYPAPSISNSDFYPQAGSAPEPAADASEPLSIPHPNAAKPGPAPLRLAAFGWLLYLAGVYCEA